LLIPTIRKDGSELWFSWNPKQPTDPVDAMFRGDAPPPDAIVQEISWRDNPWFPDVLRKEMEWDKGRDPDKYAHIWAGGYLRNSEARVFKNWRIGSVDEFNPKPETRFYLGADWGFAADPSVLVRCYFEGRSLFVDYEAWAIGCDIDYTPFLFGGSADPELQRLNAQAFASPGMQKWKSCPGIPDARKWPITADSARPETISYMQRHGWKIQPAKKGAGSVEDGIEFLKSYDIVVHPRCVHVADELTLYSWKVDPLTQAVLPLLEDKKNHTIDSLRYGVESLRAPRWRPL
jgi:phage terminase large subunit